MDELRFIIRELNKICDKDYNMISFGSLSEIELLQILANLLAKINSTNQYDVAKNKEEAMLNILMALQAIKYIPDREISASEFREGLIMGRRNILHPIFFWILSNMEKVRKRVYFSRFAEKVEIPPELQVDQEIQNLFISYNRIIDEFWTSYNENNSQQKHAEESKELQDDTKKMAADMTNLVQRLEMQNDKLKNIPNRERLLNSVKSYRNESKQKEKLQEQLRDHKNLLLQMEADIKMLDAKAKTKRPENQSDPVQHITEELQVNKILKEGQLPKELEECLMELQAFEKVAQEMEPTQDEMESLSSEMESLSNLVQGLLNKKMTLTNTSDDQLLPFRNQAAMIANKKQEVSSLIMKIKGKNDAVLETLENKMAALRELVGGDILHGDELKIFIANLRERSVIYKKFRAFLQGLQAESGIATRTLEILKLQDASVGEAIDKKRETTIKSDELPMMDDVGEVKRECKALFQQGNLKRAECQKLYEELTQSRAQFEAFNDAFNEKKREFDNSTGSMSDKIVSLEQSFEDISDHIGKEETEWKMLRKEVEKYEMILSTYGEKIQDRSDVTSVFETLSDTLKLSLKVKKDHENQIERQKQMKSENNDELEQLQRLKQMILFKMQPEH